MSSGDLEELRKLARLAKEGKITLLISDAVKDEFSRNRENVIAESIAQFKSSKYELQRPNIFRPHQESVELEKIQARFRELTKILLDRVTAEAVAGETIADTVIQEIFASAEIKPVPLEVFSDAMQRVTLRKPPGKKDSCGDAIHWEWLLGHVAVGEDLQIISRDSDFESKLSKGALDPYLATEWKQRKSSECSLYASLSDFLKKYFASIELADQLAKVAAVERLEQSSNFATTHNVIAQLSQIDDFTDDELRRMLEACISNSQILWIIGDADVREFAGKLVKMARANGLEAEAGPIEDMLVELDFLESS
jgi:hypothetical protein